MRIDLKGHWNVELETDEEKQTGIIKLPGTLQGQGFGNVINYKTQWVSGLHDNFWYEQEEYKQAQGSKCLIPFLAQPPRHFLGKAFYEREFVVEGNDDLDVREKEWFLRIELPRWRTKVWIDNHYVGEDCSLCTAHEIPCGRLSKGRHVLRVCIDNSMQYPYRPDGHGVSDALGATWNGMAGEILLETAEEREERKKGRKEYAKSHPRRVEVRDGNFYIDGAPFYFRATHFGGDYPLTGCPVTDKSWWLQKMKIMKAWGLNAIRCHSYCPPEAAFLAADEMGMYLLVECGMWNIFNEDIEMLELLKKESRRILEQFGHHPSFAFFSPSNEPGGEWYEVLRNWVRETKEYDRELGYEGRRVYTAQSGWFYDVEPSKIVGTDFVYFHRSAYGPYNGGTIRNYLGWKGKDYSPSLKGVKQPVICHELGQWCAYPDFKVIDKFTGYLKPSNYIVFKEQAKKQGLFLLNKQLVRNSGRNQLRLYKEELEANFRTPEIKGFELLDLHDYLGQGTALVGLLDPFWESKGYATPEEFRAFCGDTVLLTRFPTYVWKNTQAPEIPVEICHFGKEDLRDVDVKWTLEIVCSGGAHREIANKEKATYTEGILHADRICCGQNTGLGSIPLDFSQVQENSHLRFTLSVGEIKNFWDLYVYVKDLEETSVKDNKESNVVYTKEWQIALEALKQGKNVIYSPYFSDLNYECPALSIKNAFWNSQMGPTWSRNLGLVIDDKHPLFQHFPTEESGGWQWENILENARAIDLRGIKELEPIVRSIDDWNRSLPLGMMFEAKVEQGNLFFVSANLEGSFEERPAAYSLKQAIMKYVASDAFMPKKRIMASQLEEKLFPILRMQSLVKEYSFDEKAFVEREEALFEANPNSSVRIRKADFPVTINITLERAIAVEGWLYLPEQKDRAHEGFLEDYTIEYQDEAGNWKEAAWGTFKNTSLSQRVLFEETITAQNWRFVVESCYGCVDKEVWQECRDGWHKLFKPKSAVLQIAGLHVICQEEAEHSDHIFWEKEQKSATKEIDN